MSGCDHMEHRVRTIGPGDDFYTEHCGACGAQRFEGDGLRRMAWIATPEADWPWRYAFNDPVPGNVWLASPTEGDET